MNNLNLITYFIALYEEGSFTRAAERLSLSQPALSMAISKLEKDIGVQLFVKKGRKLLFTSQGKRLYDVSKESYSNMQDVIASLKDEAQGKLGTIDIGYIYTLGTHFIPALLRDFRLSMEERRIDYKCYVGSTRALIKGLIDGKHDIVFSSSVEEVEDIEFIPIYKERLVLVVPTNHRLADKKIIDLASIKEDRHIFYDKNSGIRPLIDRLFKQAGIMPNIDFEIEDDSCVAGLVASGLGVAVMPDIPILATMDVRKIPLTEEYQKRQIYIAKNRSRRLPAVAAEFYEFALTKDMNFLTADI